MKKVTFAIISGAIILTILIMNNSIQNNRIVLIQPTATEKSESSGSTHYISRTEILELIKKGNTGDAEAAFKLYKYYTFSTDDVINRRYWLEAAANSAKVTAQYNLAHILLEEKNFIEAKNWASIAAQNGESSAQKLLIEIDSAMKLIAKEKWLN